MVLGAIWDNDSLDCAIFCVLVAIPGRQWYLNSKQPTIARSNHVEFEEPTVPRLG